MKIYASRPQQSITSPSGEVYSSKAETWHSLKDWHTDHESYSGYILFNFVAFPIFSWLFLILLILYINTCALQPRIKKFNSILEENNQAKAWACKLHLQNEFTLSFIVVLFAFSLAVAAVVFGEKTESQLHNEVGQYFNLHAQLGFQRMFSLGYVLVILDALILLTMLFCIVYISCFGCIKERDSVPSVFEKLAHSLKGTFQDLPRDPSLQLLQRT